jgi:hypothetical protein
VCRNATIPLTLNVDEWTLERLLKTIVKGKLGFEAPTVLIDGDIVWEEGDGADSEEYMVNLPKTLSNLPCGGIRQGTVFELDDTTQNLSIEVTVTHQEDWPQDEETDDSHFLVGGAPPKAKPGAPVVPVEDTKLPAGATTSADNDDDVVLVLSGDEEPPTKKRRSEGDDDVPAAKKTKVADFDDIVVID